MQIKLIVIGKTNTPFVKEGFEEYQKRLKHYVNFTYAELPDVKKQNTHEQLKKAEGERLLQQVNTSDKLVLLDEKGKMFRSVEFAKQIEKWQIQSVPSVVFAVGGAFGFSEEVYRRADMKISLSPMTFSHQM
ncbi:MAG TPA: 23S rRNA (pseudouridine(1915)-N(3))-methyltransferase RlmH, partial [Flavobacteriales bacterium]|nr:23S rRNA (pseudouridine(1915)-N(3))-methyltransferase RlmH [Flavobacteriales bacterium]